MIKTSRRSFLGAGAAVSLAPVRLSAKTAAEGSIGQDLSRYVGFGNKRAGGEGDNACGEWLASELAEAGYAVERQYYGVPYFDGTTAEIECQGRSVPIYPQPVVVATGPQGLTGALIRVDAHGQFSGTMKDAIALVDLPHGRWSSMLTPAVRAPIEAAFAAGAKAAVAITNGPSGKVIALNADGRGPMFAGPVALLAPDHAKDLLAAAMMRKQARLTIDGSGGTRQAFNFVGRLDRGKRRWLAISTPRSGWFGCAAERGPGVAAWLELARWATRGLPDHNLSFLCNTGHEYEYLGAAEAMKAIAPAVDQTDFWLHIGANVAARDWHSIAGVSPLPSVDSQRYLSVSPALLPVARTLFAGQAGYEAPVSSAVLSAGELDEVIKAGYSPAAGVFGIHRYHHTADDDERCLHVQATVSAAQGFRELLKTVARRQA
ncbi:hypothetical protein [Parasphingorhabdus sp.]|uniref:hypothetical protein n=1 Tax=Parasphingorhabdus sp. TaxID=2709688 RepID=UPI003001FF90